MGIVITLLSFFILAVRKFQHQAQTNLSMHRENLYELLRFIRKSPTFLTSIQEVGKKFMTEDAVVQIKELVEELINIRTNSNFVSVTFFFKQKLCIFLFFR
jgi:hypothetical protein